MSKILTEMGRNLLIYNQKGATSNKLGKIFELNEEYKILRHCMTNVTSGDKTIVIEISGIFKKVYVKNIKGFEFDVIGLIDEFKLFLSENYSNYLKSLYDMKNIIDIESKITEMQIELRNIKMEYTNNSKLKVGDKVKVCYSQFMGVGKDPNREEILFIKSIHYPSGDMYKGQNEANCFKYTFNKVKNNGEPYARDYKIYGRIKSITKI
ncbi:hypothetical protein BPT24_028 [Tenacibaculum phage pT24]|uniref:Uncharacterized protein n=1 Tax=Tenacibaculum phage pT24 TaxID=1880590 RepID=A0A1B4XWG1_9CAUD|nr:hypothetical protein HYP10_gp028 [Tenacibaculum phage pT24]BAV39150.1 hypothetical protein BPT24_028 [Tenacibaculum phage pT24]